MACAGTRWRADGVGVVAVETAGGVTTAKHGEIGWRYLPTGYVMVADPDLQDTVRHAVTALLDSVKPPTRDTEVQPLGAEMVDESRRLSPLGFDEAVWPVRGLLVDGESVALFISTRAIGQAAVTDLGTVRLVLSESSIPESLVLRTMPLNAISIPDPSSDPDALRPTF